MKKKTTLAILILLVTLVACEQASVGVENEEIGTETVQSTDVRSSLPQLDGETFDASVTDPDLLEPVSLSPAQAQILNINGAPNRFLLQFLEGLRQETWYFDRLGYEVTFRNGEVYAEKEVEVEAGQAIFSSIYYPWAFSSEVGLPELLTITGSETFAYEPLKEAFDEDLSIAYLKGLDVGFRGEQVLYIRTIPIGEGAREGSPSFVLEQPTIIEILPTATATSSPESSTLTPEELNHQGTHRYHLHCDYSNGNVDDLYYDLTCEFTEEGLYMNGDGPIPSRNIENLYGYPGEDLSRYLTFEKDIIREDASYTTEDAQGNSVVVSVTCTYTLVDN
jgi:hypothetical protein